MTPTISPMPSLADPIDPREMLALVRSLLRLQRAEAELSASEERLHLAQESAGLAILDWTIPTNRFVHSDNFADLIDLPPRADGETLDAMKILDRIHPADVEALVRDFSADSRAAGSFHKEFRVRRRDGSVRWIASRGRFFTDAGGQPQRMLSLSFDNTARKTAERANAELAAIVASSVDAIVSVDTRGNVTSLERRCRATVRNRAGSDDWPASCGSAVGDDGGGARDLRPPAAWRRVQRDRDAAIAP